jgi:hypothetical protein
MYGYEESVLGIEGFSARLNRITQSLMLSRETPPRNSTIELLTSYRKRRGHYYVKTAQVSAIEWLTLPLRFEPGQPTTTVTVLESGSRDYFEAVHKVFLSLSLAAMKAQSRGDLTRPGTGLSGDISDLRTGRWIVQSRERLDSIMNDLRPESSAEATGDGMIEAGLSRQTQSPNNIFLRLASAWKREKLVISSMTAIEDSPHYQGIIALGEPVIPLLLRELERDPDYWFTALQAITGEDPVPAADRGDLLRMKEHWLTWGRRTGRLE